MPSQSGWSSGHSREVQRPPGNRLGYESLHMSIAYLKGKDAEAAEAQEHANSRSGLALYA